MKETLRDFVILAPKFSIIDEVNSYMFSLNDNKETKYFSSNSICKTSLNRSYQVDFLTLEVLNSFKCSRLPNHNLKLKLGTPIVTS